MDSLKQGIVHNHSSQLIPFNFDSKLADFMASSACRLAVLQASCCLVIFQARPSEEGYHLPVVVVVASSWDTLEIHGGSTLDDEVADLNLLECSLKTSIVITVATVVDCLEDGPSDEVYHSDRASRRKDE